MQRAVIPQPDAADRGGVPCERGGIQALAGAELAFFDPFQAVRGARHADVVLDEGPLGRQLVRRDSEPLHDRRVDSEPPDPGE